MELKYMKKIALIEDRYTRQLGFLEQNEIELDAYEDVLSNFIEDGAQNLIEQIVHNTFDLQEYAIIICHKSVVYEDKNTIILSNLRNYCKKHSKTLILFSGGISVNYYDTTDFELLELNSKIFYSKNLVLFLQAVQNGTEDIMMLCYGEHWKQNIVANILEETNLFIFDVQNGAEEPSSFHMDANLKKTKYQFYELREKTIYEIIKFKESLEGYFDIHIPQKSGGKSLIVHHDNVCELQPFAHHVKFLQGGTDDIDVYISNEIIKELAQKEFDTIFIKDNLSSNYLELYGLRVAYHIRLSSELGEKRFTPIVIISDFESDTLNKFAHEANILFTEGGYLCKNTKEEIHKYQSLALQGVSDYDAFLSRIEVLPPKDTSGSHAIANKWSIYKWAEALDVKSDVLAQNRDDIENMLYFKYLIALHAKKGSKNQSILEPSKKGKVLLIDDEWAKGWSDILKTALTKDGLEFSAFEYDFKDKTNFNLIVQLEHKELREQITHADVVLLDLRLLESDHENEVTENYSGIKILQKIHEINAGIQVIMLTATSKSSILEKLYEKKILGYIKKEHPEDKSIDTIENINKLVGLVNRGLEREYLKKVFLIQKELLALPLLQIEFSFNMDENDKKLLELKNTISKIFPTLDSNIPKPFIYGMLTLYKCIETINDYLIYERYDVKLKKQKAYWRMNNQLISSDGNASVNNKTRNILRLLEINENDTIRLIDELSCSRNYEIHPGEIKPACQERVVLKPNETHIIPWFELIKTILNK